jgi:hypothetical protein
MGAASYIPHHDRRGGCQHHPDERGRVLLHRRHIVFLTRRFTAARVAEIRSSRALKQWLPAARSLFLPTICVRSTLTALSLYSSVVMKKASANPKVVTRPTCLPPYLKASGIMVSASMVKSAPPAKDCTKATVAAEAPSKKA